MNVVAVVECSYNTYLFFNTIQCQTLTIKSYAHFSLPIGLITSCS